MLALVVGIPLLEVAKPVLLPQLEVWKLRFVVAKLALQFVGLAPVVLPIFVLEALIVEPPVAKVVVAVVKLVPELAMAALELGTLVPLVVTPVLVVAKPGFEFANLVPAVVNLVLLVLKPVLVLETAVLVFAKFALVVAKLVLAVVNPVLVVVKPEFGLAKVGP